MIIWNVETLSNKLIIKSNTGLLFKKGSCYNIDIDDVPINYAIYVYSYLKKPFLKFLKQNNIIIKIDMKLKKNQYLYSTDKKFAIDLENFLNDLEAQYQVFKKLSNVDCSEKKIIKN